MGELRFRRPRSAAPKKDNLKTRDSCVIAARRPLTSAIQDLKLWEEIPEASPLDVFLFFPPNPGEAGALPQ